MSKDEVQKILERGRAQVQNNTAPPDWKDAMKELIRTVETLQSQSLYAPAVPV